RRALLEHRSDQQARTEEIRVGGGPCGWVIGEREPEAADQRQPCLVRFPYGGVEVRHQLRARVEELAADRLDGFIVQVLGLGQEGLGVLSHFGCAVASRVPSPRTPPLPGASVTAERWAEGAELDPAHEELRCELLRRHKAADIC